jgi:hypothetical protein
MTIDLSVEMPNREHLTELSRNNATVYRAMMLAERGDCTFEQALIAAVLTLADQNRSLFDDVLRLRQFEQPPSFST